MAINVPWFEKYRPSTIDDFIFQTQSQKDFVNSCLANGELPSSLMLSGSPGTGKTTLARILIKSLNVDDVDLLNVDASKDNSVDFIRNVIIPFAESYPLGKFKIVHLAEFDYLSQQAQGLLRTITEDSSATCRFIATCNYGNKIIPALKSRFQSFIFKAPNEEDVLVRAINILDAEKIEFDPEILYDYVRATAPDIRKLINSLQAGSTSKTLKAASGDSSSDWKFKLLDLIKQSNFTEIQKLSSAEISPDELEEVYEFIYKNLNLIANAKSDNSVYENAVLVIADSLRAHAVSGIPHVTFHSACIRLMQAING